MQQRKLNPKTVARILTRARTEYAALIEAADRLEWLCGYHTMEALKATDPDAFAAVEALKGAAIAAGTEALNRDWAKLWIDKMLAGNPSPTPPAAPCVAALYARWVAAAVAVEQSHARTDADVAALMEACEAARIALLSARPVTVQDFAQQSHAILHFELGQGEAGPLSIDADGSNVTDRRQIAAFVGTIARVAPSVGARMRLTAPDRLAA